MKSNTEQSGLHPFPKKAASAIVRWRGRLVMLTSTAAILAVLVYVLTPSMSDRHGTPAVLAAVNGALMAYHDEHGHRPTQLFEFIPLLEQSYGPVTVTREEHDDTIQTIRSASREYRYQMGEVFFVQFSNGQHRFQVVYQLLDDGGREIDHILLLE